MNRSGSKIYDLPQAFNSAGALCYPD